MRVKLKKNKIRGNGKYTDSSGIVYEGKFRYGTFKSKIDKRIRKVIKLNLKTGIENSFEIKLGSDSLPFEWYEAEKNSLGKYELTDKGRRAVFNAIRAANDRGSSGGSSGSGSSGSAGGSGS